MGQVREGGQLGLKMGKLFLMKGEGQRYSVLYFLDETIQSEKIRSQAYSFPTLN